MHATTCIFFDKRHPKLDGKCSLSIRITHKQIKRFYKTGVSLSLSEYDKVFGERPRKEHKDVAMSLRAMEAKAVKIIEKMQFFTWHEFEKLYLSNTLGSNDLQQCFNKYYSSLRSEGRIGTAVSYECACKSLWKFNPNAKLSDVTVKFLSQYEVWMLAVGNSLTTIGIYLRSLRTIINIAIEDQVFSKEAYPFGKRKYEIPQGRNIKKALSLNDIGKIYNFETVANSTAERCKDYFLFSFFANGINIKDMCLLKFENISGDFIEFTRAKTARTKRNNEQIRVVLLDELKEIIERQGNKDRNMQNFIFPILSKNQSPTKQYKLIKQVTALVNDHMKIIAASIGIEAKVTSYVARHSYSSVQMADGASTDFISKALGHSDSKTTRRYLANFENEKLIEAAKALTAFKKPNNDK